MWKYETTDDELTLTKIECLLLSFCIITHYFSYLILSSCFNTICIVKSANINKGDLTW